MPMPYRQTVAALITRPKKGAKYNVELLLAHKPRKNHAWGLPQGGTERGESYMQTAVREVREELGIEIVIDKVTEISDRYKWPWFFIQKMIPVYGRRFRGQQRRYVVAHMKPNQTITPDQDELDTFKWVTIDELDDLIESPVYLANIKKVLAEAAE
jgi:8-oxo-dGTP pyrophosphatase MutT (NUDIX family)